ncbi:MAG: hypothetical protein ABGZ17_17635 [Planctomycetaceae bacterium]
MFLGQHDRDRATDHILNLLNQAGAPEAAASFQQHVNQRGEKSVRTDVVKDFASAALAKLSESAQVDATASAHNLAHFGFRETADHSSASQAGRDRSELLSIGDNEIRLMQVSSFGNADAQLDEREASQGDAYAGNRYGDVSDEGRSENLVHDDLEVDTNSGNSDSIADHQDGFWMGRPDPTAKTRNRYASSTDDVQTGSVDDSSLNENILESVGEEDGIRQPGFEGSLVHGSRSEDEDAEIELGHSALNSGTGSIESDRSHDPHVGDSFLGESSENLIFQRFDPQNQRKELGSGAFNTAYEFTNQNGQTQVLKLAKKPITFSAHDMRGLRGLTSTANGPAKLHALAGELAASRLTAKRITGVVTPTTYLLQRSGHLVDVDAAMLKTYIHSNGDAQLKYIGQIAPLAEGRELRTLKESNVGDAALNLLGVLRGMAARGFIHRDLKPDNILFEEKTNEFNVVDLGTLGKFSKQGADGANTFTGTMPYLHPRVANATITKNPTYGYEADLYSAAMTLLNTRYPRLQTALQYLTLHQLVQHETGIRPIHQVKQTLLHQGVDENKLEQLESKSSARKLQKYYDSDTTDKPSPFTRTLFGMLENVLADTPDVDDLRSEMTQFASHAAHENSFENFAAHMLDRSVAAPQSGTRGRDQWCGVIDDLSSHAFLGETRRFQEMEVPFEEPDSPGLAQFLDE